MSVYLSVVIPAYNEEKNILEAIRRVEAFMSLKGWDWELVKDAFIPRGVLAAQGKYVLVMNPDLCIPIKEVDKLIAVLEQGHDVAIGSRAGGIKLFFLKGFQDTKCNFRCFKKEVAHELFALQEARNNSFGSELLRLAVKRGYKIKEVPVMWRRPALG
jgi:dolichyl-phosphate beta-glucosyltransferase